jgi:cysteine desulfurase/selenocysteine lyase
MNEVSNLDSPARDHNSVEPYDVDAVRADFPILEREVYGQPLVYLDNAASAQKPRQVLDAIEHAYTHSYANVHRGVHRLSQEATDLFEEARTDVARFINAEKADEVVFTRGGTEAMNLVVASYGRNFLQAGDEVIISTLEHHSNIVPWQLLRDQIGIVIKVVPIDDDGNFDLDAYHDLLSDRTKFVSVTQMSNALGKITPIKAVIDAAHRMGVPVMVDGCQAVTHLATDVRALDADFYVFSSHKLYGPTGIGALYGKYDLLDKMPPYQGGGEMISSVSFEKSIYKKPPHRFEAGTPAIAQVIGFGAAIRYLEELGMARIAAHEAEVVDYAHEQLAAVPGLQIFGSRENKASIVSFVMECAHAHDIGTIVDRAGVAVRTGHHCAQPLMERLGVAATARASFGLYNTKSEVDSLVAALRQVEEIFG